MAANLSKNGPALMEAYKEVVDGKSHINWALFTYEGNSNDIRLAAKGDGGLEEMLEEMNSGKVMYGFCRVQDPNSGLPKYVLINWTGEGVKESRKGFCANHVSSMAAFLKGAHVTVNARAEDDVEPDTILAKVAKASGGNFNFQKQSQQYTEPPQGPVGSVYRKVNAVEEIQQTKKNDFWVQAQRDEELRRQQESRRSERERLKLENERREMEEKQAEVRERMSRERNQNIEQERIQQKKKEEEERQQEQQQQSQQETKIRTSGIGHAASVQKANEARNLISQRSFNPRDIFQQNVQARSRDTTAMTKPGKLQSPFLSQKSLEAPVRHQTPPPPATDPASYRAPPPSTPPTLFVLPSSPVEVAEASDTEEDDWSDEFDDDADETTPGTPNQEDLYNESEQVQTCEDLYENVYQDTSGDEDNGMENTLQTVSARALYDYQAADDTEITFDPGDIITQIEMLDEGWWRGIAPDGRYGMFPANYVELI